MLAEIKLACEINIVNENAQEANMKRDSREYQSALDASVDWLVRVNGGEISEAEQEEFIAWLEESSIHQLAYIEAEALWEKSVCLKNIKREERNGLINRLLNSSKQFFSETPIYSYAATASLILFVSIGVTYFIMSDTEDKYEKYLTNNNEFIEIHALDGSTIYMGENSEILMNVSGRVRDIQLLGGEAYFRVAKVNNTAFTVRTSFGEVRVLGTEFSVTDLGTKTLVTVVEGSVSYRQVHSSSVSNSWPHDDVLLSDVSEFYKPKVLKANQQLEVDSKGETAEIKSVDARRSTLWKESQVEYSNTPLESVLKDIQFIHGVNIEFKEEINTTHKVTAVLNVRNLESCLDSLSLHLGLKYTKDEEIIIFSK